MSAEPKVEGSKRVGRLVVLREAAVEPREGRCGVGMWTPTPVVVVVEVPPTSKGVRRGEEVWRLAFLGEERWAWKRSRRWGWSGLRIPFRSRIFLKLASDLSAMWMR